MTPEASDYMAVEIAAYIENFFNELHGDPRHRLVKFASMSRKQFIAFAANELRYDMQFRELIRNLWARLSLP